MKWTEVEIPKEVFIETSSLGQAIDLYREIDEWCNDNCKGQVYWLNGTIWKFEKANDAAAFKLRWT